MGRRPSILYPDSYLDRAEEATAPPCFADLGLDLVVAAVTAGRDDDRLTPLFHRPLRDPDAVEYRQEVFADLEVPEIFRAVAEFAQRRLVAQFRYRTTQLREDDGGPQHFHRARLLLNAVDDYCAALIELEAALRAAGVGSRGLAAVRDYLAATIDSEPFRDMHRQTVDLERRLDEVRYLVAIDADRITVAHDDDGADYGAALTATFARFRGRTTAPARRSNQDAYLATGVLDLVARLYPDLFAALDAFCARRLDYLDPVIAHVDRDIHFYLAYLAHIRPLRDAGLSFCRATVSATDKDERILDTFDLALAHRLHAGGIPVVVNDITTTGRERILVVTGPNNGGKTTLARAFGQVHWLARLGCPVPGTTARLLLCDRIVTHFPRADDAATVTGRLQAELDRLHTDLESSTPATVIILNEIFESTTAADALDLGRRVLAIVTALDALCMCVTFLDELARPDDRTVSMVATVDPDDPAVRTHRIVRRPADGHAYAAAIADKYGLGFDHLVRVLTR